MGDSCRIEIEKPTLSTIHLLPCSIEYDGTAPVKSFFHISREADETLRSHLRGRELKGRQLSLNASFPQAKSEGEEKSAAGIVGLCVGDSGNKNWVVEGHFSTINVWEHDTLPDMSHIDDCLSWFSIADSIHSV